MAPGALTAFALAACLAWVVGPDLRLRFRSDAITGTGEVRAVRLEDGSTAYLAPTTAIAFASGPAGRTLNLLQGEAWFDVVHDKARPFRVLAGDAKVTVLGTAFSVRRKPGGAEVAVQRGRVAVAMADGARLELAAGQSVSAEEGPVRRAAIRPDRVAGWRRKVAIVNDRSVADVIDDIRPWYGGYIVARGEGLTSRRVSGIYDLRDPDRALDALARAHQLSVVEISPWLRIVTVS